MLLAFNPGHICVNNECKPPNNEIRIASYGVGMLEVSSIHNWPLTVSTVGDTKKILKNINLATFQFKIG